MRFSLTFQWVVAYFISFIQRSTKRFLSKSGLNGLSLNWSILCSIKASWADGFWWCNTKQWLGGGGVQLLEIWKGMKENQECTNGDYLSAIENSFTSWFFKWLWNKTFITIHVKKIAQSYFHLSLHKFLRFLSKHFYCWSQFVQYFLSFAIVIETPIKECKQYNSFVDRQLEFLLH